MQLKRILAPATSQPTLAVRLPHGWVLLADVLQRPDFGAPTDPQADSTDLLRLLGNPLLVAALEAYLPTAPDLGALPVVAPGSGPLLPFAPAAYRDFMLSEQRFLDAGRGYLRRFRPGLARFVRAYERVLGTFPALRPKPLWYQQPIYYLGNHLNFVTEGAAVAFPPYSQALDYELELGFFIAQPLKDATPEQALAAIADFLVLNDFSARDVQIPEMESGFGPQKAKHFLTAMSEVVPTAHDVLPVLDQLQGEVYIDGQLIAHTSTAHFYFSLGQALAHASWGEQLHPGELFGSGTLPGGSGMERNVWLRPGQQVELRIKRLGSLTDTIR